jgi:rubrerythrin
LEEHRKVCEKEGKLNEAIDLLNNAIIENQDIRIYEKLTQIYAEI